MVRLVRSTPLTTKKNVNYVADWLFNYNTIFIVKNTSSPNSPLDSTGAFRFMDL